MVIALHHEGLQRLHDGWAVSPMDHLVTNLRKLKTALSSMTKCVPRTLDHRSRQSIQCHNARKVAKCRTKVPTATAHNTMWSVTTTKLWNLVTVLDLQARNKHVDPLESAKFYEEVHVDNWPTETRIMSSLWMDTMMTPKGAEIQTHDERL